VIVTTPSADGEIIASTCEICGETIQANAFTLTRTDIDTTFRTSQSDQINDLRRAWARWQAHHALSHSPNQHVAYDARLSSAKLRFEFHEPTRSGAAPHRLPATLCVCGSPWPHHCGNPEGCRTISGPIPDRLGPVCWCWCRACRVSRGAPDDG